MSEFSELVELAERIGGEAWPLLVRAEYLNACIGATFGCLFLILGVASLSFGVHAFNKDRDICEPLIIGGGVALIAGLVAIGINILALIDPSAATARGLIP